MATYLSNITSFPRKTSKGLGMRFFEFIYLKRKWSYDKKTLLKSLTHTRKTTLPLWLIIFPEGTVITADTKSKSLSYAKKADIPDRPELVLIPKTTGLFFCAKTLQPSVDALFDVTIAYSGLGREECPYDEYPLTKVFWGGEGPRRVYMHVRKYKVSELPGFTKNEPQRTGERERTHIREDGKTKEAEDEEETEKRLEAFGLWLRKLFMEKDEMMKQFHESGGKILGPPSTTTRSVAANGNGHASHSHEYRHEVDGHASTNGVTVANGETVRADVDTDKDRKVFRIKPKLLDIVNVVGVNLAFGVLWVFIVGWILRWWVPK
ncbi:hypothetical protein HK102_005348 [Quaeritorhiza haematococci]|nr:hypothetical protein HK102_005348 [Quaeritorhiza haematococci]